MLERSLLLAVLALMGCTGSPVGKPCVEDNECGPGFDCYRKVCVQVCTKDDECPTDQTCFRYHCITPGADATANPPGKMPAAKTPATKSPTARNPAPPLPDATAAELRAIRRELELVRRDLNRLLEQSGANQGGGKTVIPLPRAKAPPKK